MSTISNMEVNEEDVVRQFKKRKNAAIGQIILGFLFLIPSFFVSDIISFSFFIFGIVLFISGILILIIWHGIYPEKLKQQIRKQLAKKYQKRTGIPSYQPYQTSLGPQTSPGYQPSQLQSQAIQSNIRFCTKCGARNPITNAFCTECGNKL